MKLPETKQGLLTERDQWEAIINSPECFIYRKFLVEHINYLQKDLNDLLRTQKFTEAYGKLCALDDANRMLSLVTIRLSEINKNIEQGGNK